MSRTDISPIYNAPTVMQFRIILTAVMAIAALAISSPAYAVKVAVTGVSLSDTDNPLRTIESATFSPDGQKLLILGNLTSGSAVDYAYTVPLTGGMPTKVSDGTVDVDYVPRYSPDGSSIFYAADAGSLNNLYKIPAAGGAATTITTEDVRFVRLTPDGQTVVFQSRPTGVIPDVLKTVSVNGGAVTTLTTATQGDTDRASWGISPDGQTVVFGSTFVNMGSANEDSLFKVPVDGSAAPTLIDFGPLAPHIMDIDEVAATDDGRVMFITDYTVNNNYNLHLVSDSGGTTSFVPDLNLPSGADIRNFTISPNGEFVAFSSDYQTVGLFELFVTPVAGGGTPIKVSDPMSAEAIDLDITGDGIPDISDGSVDSDILIGEGVISWSPNGSQIAYIADGEIAEVYELYLVDNPLFVSVPGDYNQDGSVNAADYTVWRDTLNSTSDLRADGDDSGTVDGADYTFWANNFGGPISATSVPEPHSLVLLLTMVGGVVSRSSRSIR